jgi:hypothetical protein
MTDSNGNSLNSLSISFASAETKNLGSVFVVCKPGHFLAAESPGEFAIEGRFAGVGDYQNLETEPLSLAAFPGQTKEIELRAVAGTVAALTTSSARVFQTL